MHSLLFPIVGILMRDCTESNRPRQYQFLAFVDFNVYLENTVKISSTIVSSLR